MIRLFTDTSANLPLELLRQYGIGVLAFSYTINGEPVPYDENTACDLSAYYQAIRDGAVVKTSMINAEAFRSRFEPMLAKGDDVLYVGMSGGVSGAADAAAGVAQALQEKYPERQIVAFDSCGASLGEGLQVLEAARLLAQGRSMNEVVEALYALRPHVCQFFFVDHLTYLKRSGRINAATAVLGSMLNIKPMLCGDETGHIVLCGKARGFKRAMSALAERYEQLVMDRAAPVGISHADNPLSAQRLLEEMRMRGFSGECLTVVHEPATGAHIGPDSVALYFCGQRRV